MHMVRHRGHGDIEDLRDLRVRPTMRVHEHNGHSLARWETLKRSIQIDVGELCLRKTLDVAVRRSTLPAHLSSCRAHPDPEQITDTVSNRGESLSVFVRPSNRGAKRLATKVNAIASDQSLAETPNLHSAYRLAIRQRLDTKVIGRLHALKDPGRPQVLSSRTEHPATASERSPQRGEAAR